MYIYIYIQATHLHVSFLPPSLSAHVIHRHLHIMIDSHIYAYKCISQVPLISQVGRRFCVFLGLVKEKLAATEGSDKLTR